MTEHPQGFSITPLRKGDLAPLWPSGQGWEVGHFRGDLQVAATQLAARRALKVSLIVEDGLPAVIVRGLAVGTITLVVEPQIAPGIVAVIADSRADAAAVRDELSVVLGPVQA